jgi:hypothetical protein
MTIDEAPSEEVIEVGKRKKFKNMMGKIFGRSAGEGGRK